MATSPSAITVTWDEVLPIDQNGVIVTYMVMYIPQEDFGESIGTNTTTVSELSVLLVGLLEYVNYTISVRAYTSKGAGPYSEPVTVLTNEAGKCF